MVNVHEAKSNLSELLRRVEQGEEIVIARGGKPVAKLVPVEALPPRVPGRWRGQVWMADDFDMLPDEELACFEASTG